MFQRIIIALFLLPLIAFSGNEGSESAFNVKGRIFFEESKESVYLADISFQSNDKLVWSSTDEDGYFKLANVPVGTVEVTVYVMGCESHHEINVLPDLVNEVEIFIPECSYLLDPIPIINNNAGKVKKHPGTATIIQPKKIELSKPVGTQDLLAAEPGVTGFTDDGAGNSRQSIGIRGLNPRRSSRVLVLEDGIPIQPALYVYPNMYYNPPVERIHSVEVIKGSGAISYGPQTMGGVINYITSRPRNEFGGLLNVTGGSQGFLSSYFEIGGWGNDNVSPEFQFLYKRGDGFRQNNEFEQFNATMKLRYVFDDRSSWYIKANWNHEVSNATYTGLTEYSYFTDPFFNPKENDQFYVERYSIDAIRHRIINDKITDVSKIYANYFSRDWWRENDIFVDAESYNQSGELNAVPYYTPGDIIRVGNGINNFGILRTFYVAGAEKVYSIKQDGKLKGKLDVGGRLHFERFLDHKKTGFSTTDREGKYFVTKGVDEEWNTWNSWSPTQNTDSIAIIGQAHNYQTSSVSFFMKESLQLKKLLLTPGVRAEVFEQERIDLLEGSKYEDQFTAVVLPGLGFNYELKKSNLFGGVHRGFTPPSSGTLKVLNFGAASAGLDLRAEKSWNYELGWRGSYGCFAFDVTGFYLDIEDMVAAGRGTVFKNLGRVTSMGLENSLRLNFDKCNAKLLKVLPEFTVTYTLMKTEIQDGIIASSFSPGDVDISGNELTYAPRHDLNVSMSKEYDNGLSWEVSAKYMSAVFTDFENTLAWANRGDQGLVPSYTLYNFNSSYKLNNHWKFNLSVKNLTDVRYIGSRLHSNPGQPQANLSSGILPGAPRRILLGVKYLFGK